MDTTDLRQTAAGALRTTTGALKNRIFRIIIAAIPVVMVNATAFAGQFAFLNDHLAWPFGGRVLFAATLETVAIYIAYHAHVAQIEDDSALRLKLSAYAFAAVIGAMNYSHYAVHAWKPTFMGTALGLLSLSSPWLWGIHSRRASRDRLRAMGLIEPRAVRLGSTRWLWHSLRSAQAMYHATWAGENDPQRAIGMYDMAHQARQDRKATRQALRDARRADLSPGQQRAIVAQDAELARQAAAVAQASAPALTQGTTLNGHPVSAPDQVHAIAGLNAKAVLGAKHDIDPQRLADARARLAAIPASQPLPSQRDLAATLCDEPHDHRRQAQPLLAEAKADREIAARRLVSLHSASSSSIATPVANLPGGMQAHG